MADATEGIAGLSDLMTKMQTGGAGSNANIGSLLGSMSMTFLLINLVAGLLGTAYFMYGKKQGNMKILCGGLALCIVPLFISNTFLLVMTCLAMAAAPFLL